MLMGHHITLTSDCGELRVKLTCTEPKEAPCRTFNEDMGDGETVRIEGGDCWAVQFVEDAGMEDVLIVKPDGNLLSVPVNIYYDDCVIAEVVTETSPTGTHWDDAVQAGAYAFDTVAGDAPEDYPGDWETAMGESRRIITAAYPAMEKEIRAKVAKELAEQELGYAAEYPPDVSDFHDGYLAAMAMAQRIVKEVKP